MPEQQQQQFEKVKQRDNDVAPDNSIITGGAFFPDAIRKQEGARFGSGSNISNSNGDICRICHCEADVGNQLLSPCYCSGSLKYVHQTCLQQWLAASDTRSCELCKFNFILHTKIKPISEWRRLEMSSVERRRLLCAILFHFVAAVCVVWSLFVLIDRAAEEVQKGLIAWPFWTKLVVVAVGFTGGAVFMYIQCRQYLHLFSRWKAHNRIILVQNAPDKNSMIPPSPNFVVSLNPPPSRGENNGLMSSQVLANIECNPAPHDAPKRCFYESKDETGKKKDCGEASPPSARRPRDKGAVADNEKLKAAREEDDGKRAGAREEDALELNIQEILALDMEYVKSRGGSVLGHSSKAPSGDEKGNRHRNMFKSLPNLSASNENLLV